MLTSERRRWSTVVQLGRVVAFGAGLVLAGLAGRAEAQDVRCPVAVAQLRAYAVNVNTMANYEANQGVAMRCGFNQWCQQQWLYQVNLWYAQQASLVNGWYGQIVQACSAGSVDTAEGGRRPRRPPAGERTGRIDEEEIENIDVDRKDQTVRIRIPSNPQGFR